MANTVEKKSNPPEESKDPRKYWIIDTVTKDHPDGFDWREIDFTKNPGFMELQDLAKSGKLADRNPQLPWGVKVNPNNFVNVEHMEGTETYKTEVDGLIFVDNEDDARRILDLLKKRDPTIKLSGLGRKFS